MPDGLEILGPTGPQQQNDQNAPTQDPQGQPADGEEAVDPSELGPLATEEPPEDFQGLPDQDLDDLWAEYDQMYDQQAQAVQGQGLENPPQGDNSQGPAPNQGEGEQSSQSGSTPTEGDSAPFSLPEDFDVQDIPDHMDPEDAYNYARYVHSQKDKVQNQNQQLQQKVEEYEELVPVAKYLMSDPNLLAQVAELIQGRQGGQPASQQASPSAPAQAPQGQPAQGQQALQGFPRQGQQTERPTPPERPDDFDREEAMYQPDSDSAKYIEAREQYLEDLAEWNARQTQQTRQMLQQFASQQQQATQKQQMIQQLMYEHDMSEEEARDFYEFSTSEESLQDPDLWINAWKLKNQNGQGSPQADNPDADGDNQHSPQRSHEERMQQKSLSNAAQARRDNERRMPATAASQPSADGANDQGSGQDLFQVRDAQDPVW